MKVFADYVARRCACKCDKCGGVELADRHGRAVQSVSPDDVRFTTKEGDIVRVTFETIARERRAPNAIIDLIEALNAGVDLATITRLAPGGARARKTESGEHHHSRPGEGAPTGGVRQESRPGKEITKRFSEALGRVCRRAGVFSHGKSTDAAG